MLLRHQSLAALCAARRVGLMACGADSWCGQPVAREVMCGGAQATGGTVHTANLL